MSDLLLRTFVSCLSLAFALAILYAALVPPFHAPDESTHFQGFAAATGDNHLITDASAWSRLSHFERIRFHSEERFRPIDVGKPLDVEWKAHLIPGTDVRTGAQVRLWHLISNRYLRFPSATHQLFVLRAVNALLFSVVLAVSVVLVVYLSDQPYSQLGAFVFFFVPTAPFFGMHVSNHAWLVSAYVLTTAAVLILVLDGERSHHAGAMLAIGLGVALSASRSAMPMLGLTGGLLIARMALGTRSDDFPRTVASAAVFWLGLWLGICATVGQAEPGYWSNLSEAVRQVVERWGLNWTTIEPLVGPRRLVTVLAPAGLAGEILAAWLRRQLAGRRLRAVARFSTWVAAVAVLLIPIGSLFVAYPQLPYVQPTTPTLRFVRDVLLVALTSFRVGKPDFLLSTTFWGGFGWLDAIPNETFLSLLPLSSGVALTILLFYVAKSGDVRRLVWLTAVGAGFLVSMALYAVAIRSVYAAETVHGRYVAGLYLAVLAVCWCAPILRPQRPSAQTRASMPRPVFLLVPCAAIHAYSLWVILTRYF